MRRARLKGGASRGKRGKVRERALAAAFVAGGIFGGTLGTRAARGLSSRGGLTTVFAILIFAVATFMLFRSASALLDAAA